MHGPYKLAAHTNATHHHSIPDRLLPGTFYQPICPVARVRYILCNTVDELREDIASVWALNSNLQPATLAYHFMVRPRLGTRARYQPDG